MVGLLLSILWYTVVLNLKLGSGMGLQVDGNDICAIPSWAFLLFPLDERGRSSPCQDKEVIVDMTQSLDGEEAAAVVEDLVKADAMQWDMKLVLDGGGGRCIIWS